MDPIFLGEVLAASMLLAVTGALFLGFPVAFTLAGVAILFALLGQQLGVFDPSYFAATPSRLFGILTNETLIAVPFFILMGMILERSGVAAELMTNMGRLLARLRGGLGVAIVLVGALLAACTGVVGATIATIALITLPTLIQAGYDKRLISGMICASGTLGTIIPPSVVLVFLSVLLEASYTEAQMALGNYAPRPLSVGDLFVGAMLPGLLLALLYILYVIAVGLLRPGACPPIAPRAAERDPLLAARLAIAIIPALFLIIGVLGSILAGLATPTESASVGAVGALLLMAVKMAFGHSADPEAEAPPEAVRAMLRFWLGALIAFALAIALYGAFGALTLVTALAVVAGAVAAWRRGRRFFALAAAAVESAAKLTAMVFMIFFGATLFSLVFSRLGGDELVRETLTGLPGGATTALLAVMAVVFVLGFFLDTFEIIFLVVPITAPTLFAMEIDPIWLAILLAVNLQTSFITPPFGFSLFYFKSVAAQHIPTATIYRGVAPIVLIQLLCLGLLWIFPALATGLPRLIFG